MYTRAKILLVLSLFSWSFLPASAFADDVTLTGIISFGALDGSPEDHDGTVNGVFTVNDGDLVIQGTVQCNDDPPLPGNAGACQIAIDVGGDLIVAAGGGIFAENRRGGGEGGDITLSVGGDLILHGPSGELPGAVVSSSRLTGKDSAGDITFSVQGGVTLDAGSTVAAGTPNGASGAIGITAGGTVSVAGLVASGPSRQVLGTRLTGRILEGGESKQSGGAILIRSTGSGLRVEGSGIIVSQGESPGSQFALLEACGIEIRGLVASLLKQDGSSQVVARSGEGLLIDGRDLGSPEPNPGRLGLVRADGSEGGSAGFMVDLFANGDIEVLGPTSSTLFAVSSSPGAVAQRSGGAITAISLAGALTVSGNAFEAGKENTGNQGGIIDLKAKGNATLDGATLRAVGDFVTNAPSREGGSISVRSYQGSVSWTFGVGDVRPTGSGVPPSRRGSITLTACSGIDTTGSQFPTVGSPVLPFPVENDGVCSSSAPALPDGEPPLPVCNQPPAVTTTAGATAFTEDGGPVVVDSGVTVMDDDANLASATVTITNPQDGTAEVLSANCPGLLVTPSLNSLSITGDQPVATYQSCLQSVTYDNTSQNPNTTTRVVAFTASDGTASSAPANKEVTVAASNDAPVVTTTAGTTTFTEDGGPVVVDSGVMVEDDDDANLESAMVSLASAPDGAAEVLNATNCGSLTVAPGNPLMILGSATVATYQTCLQSVTYENTSQSPSTTDRTVNFVVNDGDSDSNTASKTLSVTAVNDAPVVTTTVGTTSFTEDGGAVVVDALVAVSDNDDTNLESATVSLASAPDGSAEILNATNCGSLMVAPGNPLAISGPATVAVYQACLRSVTYNNSSQNPNTINRAVNFLVNDGESNSNTAPKTVSVTAVNDAPTANPDNQWDTIGNTRLIVAASDPGPDESGPYVFVAGNVLANDMDPDGPAASLTATLANANGATVTLNSDGTFTYVPPPGAAGPTHSFTYNAFDGLVNSVGTVTIDLVSRVWYVNNDDDGGTGVSNDPFATLSEAQTASVAGDTIYVFTGNGDITGQDQGIVLKANQRLIGEGVQLDVPGSVNGGPDPTPLRDPGETPAVIDNTNAGGDAVSATDAIPARIAGLSLIGSANAIDITTNGAFGGSGGLTIANNAIDNTARPGGAEGIDINLGGSGTVTLAVRENDLTAANTAIDITRTAGTVIIAALNDNTVSGDTGGSGIVVSGPATFDATPGGVLDPVSGGVTVIGDPGNAITGSGLVLSSVTGALDFTDLDVFAGGGAGVSVTGTGAYTGAAGTRVTVGVGVGIIEATGNAAVDLTNMTADLQLSSFKSTNTSTRGVSLTNVSDGTTNAVFSAGSGSSITTTAGAAGPAFNISGGNAKITYGGTITNNGTGRAVSITTWSGDDAAPGDDLLLSGAIDENGAGILVNGNGGSRAITFSGGMDIDTTTGEGFAATSNTNALGLHITGTNTIDSISATALRVTNTPIGLSNLNFQRISSGNNTAAADPVNGIVLSNTGSSGGLIVTGSGGSCTEGSSTCTGGWIQNVTGGDDSGATPGGTGIVLNNTADVSLTRMRINDTSNYGIRGTNVSGFTFTNGVVDGANGTNVSTPFNEGSLVFFGVTGTSSGMTGTSSITNSTIMGGRQRNIAIDNSIGTLNLTVSGNTIKRTSDAAGDDGLFLEADTSANVTLAVTNNTFARHGGDHINVTMLNNAVVDLTITGNTLHGNYPGTPEGNHPIGLSQGIFVLGSTFNGTCTYEISNNGTVGTPFRGNRQVGAIHVNKGSGTGTFSGSIENNVIGDPAVTGSGSSEAFGIIVGARGAGSHTTLINNNLVRQYFDRGIVLEAGEGSAAFNATVTNNTVSNFADGVNSLHGIHSDNGILATDTNPVCLQISGNSVATAGNEPGGGADIRLRRGSNTTVRLPGVAGATNADATNLLQANNPTATTITVTGNGFSSGAACPLP